MLSLFLVLVLTLSAQESTTQVQMAGTNAQMKAKIDGLSKISADEFSLRVESLRSEIERYMIQKKRVCDGVFSTMVLRSNSAMSDAPSDARLTPDERKLCYRELKSLQMDFINGLYEARKRYLESLHERRMKEIAIAHDEALKEVNRTFQSK